MQSEPALAGGEAIDLTYNRNLYNNKHGTDVSDSKNLHSTAVWVKNIIT